MSRNTGKTITFVHLFFSFFTAVVIAVETLVFIPLVARNMGALYQGMLFSAKLENISLELCEILMVYILCISTCIGSFANVLIYRIPKGIPFIKGTSFCPRCSKRIMPYDLIPVFSYIFLGGKCRSCGAPVSIKYPVVELLSGMLALLAIWAYGLSLAALTCFMIFVTLMCIAFIDAEHMIIPDRLVISLAMVCMAHAALCWDAVELGIYSRVLGVFILSVPMLVLTLLIKDAFGGGDIKLIAVCGFLLGLKLVLLAGFIAIIMGGVHGVYIKYIKKAVGTTHISFGQYLCIGVGTAMIFGNGIISWYLSLLTL